MANPRQGASRRLGVISETSPGSATTAAGTTVIDGLTAYEWFTIDAALVGATGGTLDVYLQRKVGATWVDWMHFAQLAAGAAAVRRTIDSNSFETGPVTVGSGTSPALAAGKLSCAHPGDAVRALYVAGAGTSAGAAVSITITGWQSAS